MDKELSTFVEHARERGLDFATIRALLEAAGWDKEEIAGVYAAQTLEMEVPEPRTVGSARDVFLHVLAFTALYAWITSLVVLLFTYVNLALPDEAWRQGHWWREGAHDTIRSALATIVVAFPLFLFLWRRLLRDVAANPEKARSRVRRGLIYLSLFVGAVTMLTDLITLVYHLFEGELSTRFLLKVVLLFAVAGAAFLYLALTLRRDVERSE